MTGEVYVRWKHGRSRLGARYPGLGERHPGAKMTCIECGETIGPQTEVVLMAVGPKPDDDENIQKFLDGEWFTCLATLLHWRCARELDDEDLNILAQLLTVKDRLKGTP